MVTEINLNQPDQDTIDVIKGMLEMAEKGEIIGVGAVLCYQDGSTGNVFRARYSVRMLGELRMLERDIIDLQCNTRLHEAGRYY